MTDMEKLKASILARAHEQGRLNLAAAKESIRSDFEKKKAQLLSEKRTYRRSRLNDIERRVQKEKQELKNKERQSTLAAKQEVLKELFAEAEAVLTAWSEDEHLAFFRQVMTGYEEAVTVQFGQLTADKISESSWGSLLQDYPQVTFSQEFIAQEAGFLITIGRVDDNYLYSRLIRDLWETEGYLLAAEIFPAPQTKEPAEEEKKPKQPWFMTDKTLTPQERYEAMLDWREGQKQMRELEAYLARPISYTVTPKKKEKPKKTKEERLTELYRKEADLQEKEDRLQRKITHLEPHDNYVDNRRPQARFLLEELFDSIPSTSYDLATLVDRQNTKTNELQEQIQKSQEAFQKEKKKTSEAIDQVHYDRLKLFNSDDDDKGGNN